jgi:hypothetical protein
MDDRTWQVLRNAATVYAIGTFLHTADHYRRGTESVTLHVTVAGTLGLVLATVAITLIMVRHPMAPLAAIAVGIPHALGISAVHFLPDFGAFSDSFASFDAGPVTWAAVLFEVGGALATGLVGLYALRRVGRPQLA